MRQSPLSGAPATRLTAGLREAADNAAENEWTIRAYTPLLYKIATAFGFGESEARELTEAVVTYARSNRAADCYPLRIWLSKIMVHLCTARIGSRLFAQCGSPPETTMSASLSGNSGYQNNVERRLQGMPLSFRAVYILSCGLGFSTSELSLMLNTTPSAVIERYQRALAFLARQ